MRTKSDKRRRRPWRPPPRHMRVAAAQKHVNICSTRRYIIRAPEVADVAGDHGLTKKIPHTILTLVSQRFEAGARSRSVRPRECLCAQMLYVVYI